MNDRLYFLLGDSLSNIVVGVTTALLCTLIIGTNWNMFIAMLLGMPIGMLLSLILGLLVFYRYFGANEVMVPTMLSGMLSGMLVSMIAAMQVLSFETASLIGAATGILCLVFCNYSDHLIRAHQTNRES